MTAQRLVLINQAGVDPTEVAASVGPLNEFITLVGECWPDTAGSSIRDGAGTLSQTGEAQVILAPNTTVANSMGYHQWGQNGEPIGIVELDACRQYLDPTGVRYAVWSGPASHEIAEMLVNPGVNNFVTVGSRNYPKEIADPFTSGTFQIGNFTLTDFALPEFWDPAAPKGTRFNYLATPGTSSIAAGPPRGGWLEWAEGSSYTSAWGADISPEMLKYMHSRRGRRHMIRIAIGPAGV